VEKIYPLSFTKFKKVVLLDEFKARRSKLYYLRDKIGKDAKMKSKITSERRDSDLIKAK
jgi:large subunit ribosomal protein L19